MSQQLNNTQKAVLKYIKDLRQEDIRTITRELVKGLGRGLIPTLWKFTLIHYETYVYADTEQEAINKLANDKDTQDTINKHYEEILSTKHSGVLCCNLCRPSDELVLVTKCEHLSNKDEYKKDHKQLIILMMKHYLCTLDEIDATQIVY